MGSVEKLTKKKVKSFRNQENKNKSEEKLSQFSCSSFLGFSWSFLNFPKVYPQGKSIFDLKLQAKAQNQWPTMIKCLQASLFLPFSQFLTPNTTHIRRNLFVFTADNHQIDTFPRTSMFSMSHVCFFVSKKFPFISQTNNNFFSPPSKSQTYRAEKKVFLHSMKIEIECKFHARRKLNWKTFYSPPPQKFPSTFPSVFFQK
jgi:hypothetical protein